MTGTITDTIELVWDLTRERPTLGGALVLRQEGELLAQLNDVSAITLHLVCEESTRATAERLATVVFASSVFNFQISYAPHAGDGWPSATSRANPEFSYFSFSRLLTFHADNSLAPRLRWDGQTQARAQHFRARFPGRLVCVHLRSTSPFTAEESNADGPAWNKFFAAHARTNSLDFLLLGDDPLPVGLAIQTGVSRATNLGIDLATQLALIGCADGFLGMASGLCTAANLSETPHVIFKHPTHHAAEMARELGSAKRFPFAGPRQRLWRRVADVNALNEALALIVS